MNDLTVRDRNIDMMQADAFAQIQRVGSLFASSSIVPDQYKNNPSNCVIAFMQANRMGVDPFAFMQSSYVVHGKPGIESKLAISLVNGSGLFIDPMDYEEFGEDATDRSYKVRCVATRKSTKKELRGPWITWELVSAEGWDKKPGSKWKTMPQLMFMYRAAMFFCRLHCPEVLLGFQTTEELVDISEPRDVTPPTTPTPTTLASKIKPKAAPKPEPAAEKEQEAQEVEVVESQPEKPRRSAEHQAAIDGIRSILAEVTGGDIDAMEAELSRVCQQQVTFDQIDAFTENGAITICNMLEDERAA